MSKRIELDDEVQIQHGHPNNSNEVLAIEKIPVRDDGSESSRRFYFIKANQSRKLIDFLDEDIQGKGSKFH